LLFIVAAELAAVIVGVGAAFAAANRPSPPPASATHRCTHYSPPYFVGDTASQPQLCYAFNYDYVGNGWFDTDSVAARDDNYISFQYFAHDWALEYNDRYGNYLCCYKPGHGTFGFIGSSGGVDAKAWCWFYGSPDYMYCTTLW
jgi:hypothetical protein